MINSIIRAHQNYRPAIVSNVFNDFIENMFSTPSWFGKDRVGYPMNVVNITKDGEITGCRLEYALAGFDKKDIKVSVDVDMLCIVANHEDKNLENPDEQYEHNGISYRRMAVSYRLMDKAEKDNITCKFENGLLTVTVMFNGGEEQSNEKLIDIE